MIWDDEKIKTKLAYIYEDCAKLNELLQIGLENYRADKFKSLAARYLLQTGIEAAVDVVNHFVAKNKLGRPATHREAFELLFSEGIISSDVSGRLIMLIKLRNRIVHIYEDIDDELIFKYIADAAKDLKDFADEINVVIFR